MTEQSSAQAFPHLNAKPEGLDMTVNTLPQSIRFQDTDLSIVDRNGTPWVASADLARGLGYVDRCRVTVLFDRHKDEFTNDMSLVLNLNTKGFGSGESQKPIRIFSPRGCYLIAIFARPPIAAEFKGGEARP